MIRLFFLAVLLLHLGIAQATEWHVSGGSEWFRWQEFDASDSEIVTEQGPRFFVEMGGLDAIGDDLFAAFYGRLYVASVTYEGETTGETSPIPILSDSIYGGWSAEVMFSYRLGSGIHTHQGEGDWLLAFGGGYESWLRNINGTNHSVLGTVSGYQEFYDVPYAKLGLFYNAVDRLQFQIGAKYPYAVSERVDWRPFGETQYAIAPKPELSAYLSMIYQFSDSWGLQVYYDSYRFSASDPVRRLNTDGTPYIDSEGNNYVGQPKSHQDTVGLFLSYHF